MKKLIAYAVLFAMLFTMMIPAVAVVGSAEEADLEIGTAEKLVEFLQNMTSYDGKKVVLTADIDMTDKTWTIQQVVPADSLLPGFTGTFDGQGHTISNISASNTANHGAGLFGALAEGKSATIKNLAIVDSTYNTNKWQIGGLYGYVLGNLTVDNVYMDLDIGGTSTASGDIGGFVGKVDKSSAIITITNSVYAGVITCKTGSGNIAGGFIGNLTKGTATISNCAMYGSMKNAGVNSAGFVFTISSNGGTLTLQNCIYAGDTNSSSSGSGRYFNGKDSARVTLSGNNLYIKNGEKSWNGNDSTYVENSTTPVEVSDTALTGTNAQTVLTTNNLTPWTATTTGMPMPRSLVVNGLAPVEKADSAETPVTVLEGYQTTEALDGKFNFRLVATIDLPDGKTLADYNAVGFKIVANYGTTTLVKNYSTATVYQSVSAEGNVKTYTAADLGGDYIFALACTNVSSDAGTITLEVTTYYETADGVVDGATELFTVVPPQTEMSK